MTRDESLNYPESLAAAANALRQFSADGQDNERRREEVLRAATRVGDLDASRVSRFIREHLLPECLVDPADSDAERRVRGHRLRELLAAWLDDIPEETRWSVRSAVLRDVINHLQLLPTFGGLYALAAIGYRSTETVGVLRLLGLRTDRLGHEALRLLLGLAPSTGDLLWVSRRLAGTPTDERSEEWSSAAALLHDPTWIEDLAEAAIKAKHLSFGLSRLVWIGDDAPGDRALHDRIWAAIERVVETSADGWATLLFTGGVIEGCKTPEAIASLARQLPRLHDGGGVQVWRWSERVREVVSAVQIAGWRRGSPSEVARVLRLFVQASSGSDTPSMTAEGYAKEAAIEALLCSGSSEAIAIPSLALKGETSGYMKAMVLNRSAILSITPLPLEVREVISTVAGFQRDTASTSSLPLFFGAARVASSSLSVDSLRLLIGSRATIDGHPFRSVVEAAANLAVWLHKQGEPEVLPLVLTAANGASLVAQAIGVRTLSSLFADGSVPIGESTHVSSALREIVFDVSRQSYIRTEGLRGLIRHRAAGGAAEVAELLKPMLEQSDRPLRRTAISGLIELGLLSENREAIENFAFGSSETGKIAEEAAYIVGQILALEPLRYALPAASLIVRGAQGSSEAIVSGFLAAGSRAALPKEVADAVLARVRRDESQAAANPPVFMDLALLAPVRMLKEPWEGVWQGWMPDSRKACADAIPTAAARSPELTGRSVELLTALAADGVFAVRRAACRALARLEESALQQWCERAMGSGSITLRRFAAEAAAWLPIDSAVTMDNPLLRSLGHDPERLVRDAARRSSHDRRRRAWASELLDEVVARRDDPNAWVLSSYAAGTALARVGDESDLAALSETAEDATFPPNVRYWLGQMAETLEKQWKKTTEGWPESWSPWQGAIERLEGVLNLKGARYAANVSLWLRRGRSPDDVSAWGGAAWTRDMPAAFGDFMNQDAQPTLEIEGRVPARVLVVASDGRRLVLTGNGPYPRIHHE